jgi:hypothetical protein
VWIQRRHPGHFLRQRSGSPRPRVRGAM